jgi:hypothetical protein
MSDTSNHPTRSYHLAASAQRGDMSSIRFHDHQDMNEGRGMSEQTTKRPMIEEIIARYKLFNMYRSPTSNQASAIYSRAEFELYSDIEVLLTERQQLTAIADAAREWTRIEHDADEVSMDEAIEICEQLQAATEKWMSDQQAALAALDAGKGAGG